MKGKRTTSRSRQPVLPLWQEESTTRAAIDYKRLRRINPQAARQAVLEYLASVNGNVAATARAFSITRPVVYDILAKARSGDLGDRPKIPRHQPRKTSGRGCFKGDPISPRGDGVDGGIRTLDLQGHNLAP